MSEHKSKQRLSLAVRISCLLVLAAILPLMITVFIIEIFSRPTLINQASKEMETDARIRTQLIDSYFAERMLASETVSRLVPIQKFLDGDTSLEIMAREGLATGQVLGSHYQNWSLFDIHGHLRLYYPSRPQAHGEFFIPPNVLQQLDASKRTLISDVFYNPVSNEAYIDIYAPVVTSSYGMVGILRTSFDLHYLWSIINDEVGANGSGSYAFILDENGVRIAATNLHPDRNGDHDGRFLLAFIGFLNHKTRAACDDTENIEEVDGKNGIEENLAIRLRYAATLQPPIYDDQGLDFYRETWRLTARCPARFTLALRILIYVVLPVTLVLGFLQSVAALTREHSEEQPETHTESVDALIEAGREEGILHESNRDLIQSVVEFGEKTVREAMKPRPEIVAIPTNTTVEQFIELLRAKPFSRVPVFDGTIHNIVGIVHAQDVLQVPDSEAHTRTVDSLMRKEVYFVPESKLGSDLLREMQNNNIRMAIVVDEYGGVAGLVTIEDLVEEIVGEIRDEHEKAEVIRESEHSYIVPGNMDVDRLGEMFGIRPEGKESATVAGLVSELAGRIPHRGEVVEEDGLRFEVLDATERRVERVRISPANPTQMKLI